MSGPDESRPGGDEQPARDGQPDGGDHGGGHRHGGDHGLGTDLRAVALLLLDRLEPALDRVRLEPPTQTTASCATCPVCAVQAVLRGERPELAVRLAEQLGGLAVVLRAALEEGDPAAGSAQESGSVRPGSTPNGPGPVPGGASARRVQRIPIERVSR